jgi:trans-aconitate 3-methyltransferase
MSDQAPEHKVEKTFTSYNQQQGVAYAELRPGYHPSLYQLIIDFHTKNDTGKLETLLDVGCGPGKATRALASQFKQAIGIDTSQGMIDTAISLGGKTKSNKAIRYAVSGAEEIKGVEDGSVDVLIAATCAHWFNMPAFWARAAKVLKPGGTVAIWTSGGSRITKSTPNHVKIQAALDKIEQDYLIPYFEPGNVLTRNLYRNLPLPWTSTPSVSGFDEASFVRKEWADGENEEFYSTGTMTLNLDMVEKILATASPVQRWREGNPDKVGTSEDVLKKMRAAIEEGLYEAGVPKGEEKVSGSPDGVLLLVKTKV